MEIVVKLLLCLINNRKLKTKNRSTVAFHLLGAVYQWYSQAFVYKISKHGAAKSMKHRVTIKMIKMLRLPDVRNLLGTNCGVTARRRL